MEKRKMQLPISCLVWNLIAVSANLNLYLPKPEVKSLFGVDNMQMYYIRNGVLNSNAIAFKAHVQADKEALEFVWKATQTEIKVHYDLFFPPMMANEVSDLHNNSRDIGDEMKAMIQTPPKATINTSGTLPNEENKFVIYLKCTGTKQGEVTVPIVFKFRFSDTPKNITRVELKRLKRCLKTEEKNKVGVSIDENNVVGATGMGKKNVSKPKTEDHPVPKYPPGNNGANHNGSQSTYTFYISITVVTGFIFISVIMVKVWHWRGSRKMERAAAGTRMISMNEPNHPNQFLRPDLPNNATVPHPGSGSNTSWMNFTPIINDLGTDILEIRSKLSDLAVPRSDVCLDEVLQEGTFSRIYRGSLEGSTPVLIKTVTAAASEEQTRLLLFESSLLRGMHHRNILPMKHVVLDGPEPPLVMFPYTKGGNLKRYLRDIKFNDVSNSGMYSSYHKKYEQASTQDLVEMGIDVACGMTYLAKRGLVHKDVATRNCVIDSDLKVKITDNALCRDLFPADYCCLGDNENRPVRWLAMESLVHKVYSTVSDVWSFGVLLWELQSLAAMPYNDIDDYEMALYLQDGFRLSQPMNCPDHLYGIMKRCWHFLPDKRPTFSQLLQMLTEFNAELGEYV